MAKKKADCAFEPNTTAMKTSLERKGEMKPIGGAQSDQWNAILGAQVVQSLWTKHSDETTRSIQIDAAVAALEEVAPRDVLEGMMVAQMIAAHNAAMECCRRAMIGDQTFEGRHSNLNQANKLSRTSAALLDALNKHRGKGQQKVTVEHVHVHAGGQAVVGTIESPGGGGKSKLKEQPLAKQIPHAPEPALRGANSERDAMPIPRNGERPM